MNTTAPQLTKVADRRYLVSIDRVAVGRVWRTGREWLSEATTTDMSATPDVHGPFSTRKAAVGALVRTA